MSNRGRIHRILTIGVGLVVPLVGATAFAQTTTGTLTPAQMAPAAKAARNTGIINTTTGYVTDSNAALKAQGLSAAEIAYVQNTIQKYNAGFFTISNPSTMSAASYPASTAIWDAYGNHTGQCVILYEGAQPGWGWQHM